MNSGMKIILLLAALAAVGFGLYSALGGEGHGPAPLTNTPQQDPTPVVANPGPQQTSTPEVKRQDPPPSQRTQVEQPVESGSDLAQGLQGTLVNEFGQPVADSICEIYAGSGTKDLLAQMVAMNRGVVPQPIAVTRSDAGGRFQLGVKTIEQGKAFELHVTGRAHAEYNQANITLFEGRWWDAGQIKLVNGLSVVGRVVAEATGQPIADATVELKNTTQGFGFSAIARGAAATVKTDVSGSFRFDNAAGGQASIVAYAPGYARQEKSPALIRAEGENSFEFRLEPGVPMACVVTDADGKGIAGASYQVLSLSPKTPISVEGVSDASGRFEVLGLVKGPYQVIVNATGYSRKDEKPVIAGEAERQIVLERQGQVRVKVVAKNGRLIDRYNLTPKTWVNGMPGNLIGMEMARVSPRDLDKGFFTQSGLNPGTYCVQINAANFAMTFSEPFDIVVGGTDPEITVQLLEGGSLSGSVVDPLGAPLQGIVVQTQDDAWDDNPITSIFGSMIPVRISMMNLKTDAQGRFRLEKLTPGMYQLIFQHPDYTALSVREIQIREGEHTEVAPARMMPGTVVSGTVMIDGVPAPQVRVQVSTAPDPNRKDARGMISSEAVSDERGQFTLPRRLPPGRYQATAGRQGNPFLTVVDFQQTKQEFDVVQSQPSHILQFQIRTQ